MSAWSPGCLCSAHLTSPGYFCSLYISDEASSDTEVPAAGQGIRRVLQDTLYINCMGLPATIQSTEYLCFPAVSTVANPALAPVGSRPFETVYTRKLCLLLCSTGEKTLNELKQRWISAGRPELPDWETLLEGL